MAQSGNDHDSFRLGAICQAEAWEYLAHCRSYDAVRHQTEDDLSYFNVPYIQRTSTDGVCIVDYTDDKVSEWCVDETPEDPGEDADYTAIGMIVSRIHVGKNSTSDDGASASRSEQATAD